MPTIIKKYDNLLPPGPPTFVVVKEKFTPIVQPVESYKEQHHDQA